MLQIVGVVAQELESAGMNGLVSESLDRNEDNEDVRHSNQKR
jgi:hypothetical protein